MSEPEDREHCGELSPTAAKDTKRLADEAAKDLQNVLERAGVSDDLLRNVVEKVQQRGRGGRTPAGDPRLDPNIEPKKAKRILANRLSAAKSKMRQRVLSESLEILKAKENSRNNSVEPSDLGPGPSYSGYAGYAALAGLAGEAGPSGSGGGAMAGGSADEMRQVKRICLELQAKNKELEARVRVLEAQMAIAASGSLHATAAAPFGAGGLRVLTAAPAGAAFQHDGGAALFAALASAGVSVGSSGGGAPPGGGGSSGGGAPPPGSQHSSVGGSRPPLVTSSMHSSGLPIGLLNLATTALTHPSLARAVPMLDTGRVLEGTHAHSLGGAGAAGWMMDTVSLGQLMGLPPGVAQAVQQMQAVQAAQQAVQVQQQHSQQQHGHGGGGGGAREARDVPLLMVSGGGGGGAREHAREAGQQLGAAGGSGSVREVPQLGGAGGSGSSAAAAAALESHSSHDTQGRPRG